MRRRPRPDRARPMMLNSDDHDNVFSEYQPRYAAVGIPTFPCSIASRKKPLVRNYQRMGLPGSQQLVMKGLDSDALACMAGQRNKLTILDIDADGANGERLLADAQCAYGRSQFIVRTGSGGFHAYIDTTANPGGCDPIHANPSIYLAAVWWYCHHRAVHRAVTRLYTGISMTLLR